MVDAKKINVPDIQPIGFIIEILDEEQEPISGVKFSIDIDGNARSLETDEKGMLKFPRSKSEIKLSLVAKEVSSTSEESDAMRRQKPLCLCKARQMRCQKFITVGDLGEGLEVR